MGEKPSGKICIAVFNTEDARKLKNLLDEKAMTMGNAVVSLQVHEDGLAIQQAQSSRRARTQRTH